MLHFIEKRFEELDLNELYAIMALRQEVFVVEQDCVYQDLDSKDQVALHLFIRESAGDGVLAYARIFSPDVLHEEMAAIGRVVVRKEKRGTGLGKEIMRYGIELCRRKYPRVPIRISAQTYLADFYAALGFRDTGHHYLEDGIPHMEMLMDGFRPTP
jgi:ElaA protein